LSVSVKVKQMLVCFSSRSTGCQSDKTSRVQDGVADVKGIDRRPRRQHTLATWSKRLFLSGPSDHLTQARCGPYQEHGSTSHGALFQSQLQPPGTNYLPTFALAALYRHSINILKPTFSHSLTW